MSFQFERVFETDYSYISREFLGIISFLGREAAGRGTTSCKMRTRNSIKRLISGIDIPNRVNSRQTRNTENFS